MRKWVLLVCACIVFNFQFSIFNSVSAQENDGLVYPNTFYGSFSTGAFSYAHSGQSEFGVPFVNLTGGVWLSMPLAFQLSFDGFMAASPQGADNLFMIASTEFKWDVNSTFFHLYNKRYLSPIPFYPMLGMGALWAMDMERSRIREHSFLMMLGLQVPFRLSNLADAFLQYKCLFLPQEFYGSHTGNYMHTIGLGLMYRFSNDPYHRRTDRATRGLGEDWFVGLGIGPNYSAFDLLSNPHPGGLSMVGITPEFVFGRNYSNFWTLRFGLGGLTAHEIYDTVLQGPSGSYRFSFAHVDLMLNVSNIFSRKHGAIFNVMPYLGAGPVWRYDDLLFDVAANFGVMGRYYLNRRSDLYLDLRYVILTPNIGGGTGPSGTFYGVGLPSLTAGYIYNIGHNTTRYRQPLDGCAVGL